MIPARTEREALSQVLRVDKPFACFIEKRLNRFVVQVKEGRKGNHRVHGCSSRNNSFPAKQKG